MIILLDTSTPTCRLSVVTEESRAEYEWEAGRSLAKGILEFLDAKIAAHGGEMKNITGIGIMQGPGSFTGLRIGLTVANTLADSLGVPIVGELGEGWHEKALQRLGSGANDEIVLPLYGSSPHITTPKK